MNKNNDAVGVVLGEAHDLIQEKLSAIYGCDVGIVIITVPGADPGTHSRCTNISPMCAAKLLQDVALHYAMMSEDDVLAGQAAACDTESSTDANKH